MSRQRLGEIARTHLVDLKHEILTHIGDTAPAILHAEKHYAADLVVMATHGRQGISRVFLGSTAEMVLRESSCPVMTVHGARIDKHTVAHWMAPNPPVASLGESLAAIRERMGETGAEMLPVIEGGKIVGAITSRDLLDISRAGDTKVGLAMDRKPAAIAPGASTAEAASLMRERRLDAIAVVDDGQLVGVVTAVGLLGALTRHD
jgi:CBS domain-containing protein